jgi:hypothetical protein
MDGAARLSNPILCTPGESSTQVIADVDPRARVRHAGEPVLDVYREPHLVVLERRGMSNDEERRLAQTSKRDSASPIKRTG